MEGKLVKEEEGYYVFVNTVILGTTRPLLNWDFVKYKLSLDNCEDIERDVPKNDLDGWDVWVVMDRDCYSSAGRCDKLTMADCIICTPVTYLKDEDGCLILKRK